MLSRKRKILFIVFTIIFVSANIYVLSAYLYDKINPFEKIVMSENTELFDYSDTQGSNNQPIQYVEGFGIGYSWINDCVVLRDIDFGENGTNSINVYAANGDKDTLQFSVHIDDMNNTPTGIIDVTETGGFSKEYQQKFTAVFDETIKGTHTIYIKWINKTGCLVAVEFKEAEYFEPSASTSATTTKFVPSEIEEEIPPTGDNDSDIILMCVICGLSLTGLIATLGGILLQNRMKEKEA